MFDWLKSWFGRSPAGSARSGDSFVQLKARFDAATSNPETRKHWSGADALSVDAALSPAVRQTLRTRARYEYSNNSILHGIVSTLANDTVGRGPRVQLQQLTNDKLARQLEKDFIAWAREISLAEKLLSLRKSRCVDGEGLALLVTNRRLRSEVQLDLRLLECDRLTTPMLTQLSDRFVDGIELDEFSNPLRYHILKQHPGSDRLGAGFLDYDVVPAEFVIHTFKPIRPEQHRGVPEISSMLSLGAYLRRYTLATISAAELGALLTAFLESNYEPDEEDSPNPFEELELVRGALTTLPAGTKATQMKAEQPTTAYGDFRNHIIGEMGRCLDMPFNVAACNSASYNYASGRLDHQTYFLSISVDRDRMQRQVLDRLWYAWIVEAGTLPKYASALGSLTNDDLVPTWIWDSREHVDPEKEADAQHVRLMSGMTTYAREFARAGLDWEVEFQQQQREQEMRRKMGLPLVTDQQAPQGSARNEATDQQAA